MSDLDELGDIADQCTNGANVGTRSKRGVVSSGNNPFYRKQPSFRGRLKQAVGHSAKMSKRPLTLPKVDL